MKKYFVVSLIRSGILGGGMVAGPDAITYHTGKVTVPRALRCLEMRYEDISAATKGWMFVLPTVTVEMRDGNEYRFAVFFSRKRLIDTLRERGVGC